LRFVHAAHPALAAAYVRFSGSADSNFKRALAAAPTARDPGLDGLLLLADSGHAAENLRAY
jgi:hypothetical protein